MSDTSTQNSPETERLLSLLRATLESSEDGILSVDLDGRILVHNRRFAEMWRIPNHVLETHDDQAALDIALTQLEDPDAFIERVRSLYADPQASSYDIVRLKDGRIFERYSTPQEVSGRTIARAWYFRDVSQRKRAEEQVRSMALFAEMSPNLVLRVDRHGNILIANPAACQVLGLPSQDDGPKITDVLPGLHDLDLAKCIHENREERRNVVVDDRHYQLVVQGLRTFDVAQVFGTDVTERQRTEDALARKTMELERSNQDLATFAYAASHDLQEPLRIVSSYLQLLQRESEGDLNDRAREFLQYALDGANRMRALIQDLLRYARVGTSEVRLPTDLGIAFERAVKNLRDAIEESSAEVTREALPTVPAVGAEMDLLFQNLIGNAIKFRGQAQPRVRVTASAQGGAWRIEVKDNGIGLGARDAERIFSLFQRLHGRDEYPGTGIGLAICKKIVERHGGLIGVDSSPGQGSTFWFTLPVAQI